MGLLRARGQRLLRWCAAYLLLLLLLLFARLERLKVLECEQIDEHRGGGGGR
jgi:hypothetical protein